MQVSGLRKRALEMALSRMEGFPSPKPLLEQYTIPATTAAQVLWIATYTYDDIVGKTVFDLGCGTGRLAIGASMLGAKEVIGVDIDPVAIKIAAKNAMKVTIRDRPSWIVSDISLIRGRCDTVIQNPPFGVQKRGADRKFLRKALEIGKVVYSIHKGGEGNREFIKAFIDGLGGKIAKIIPMKMAIPPTFSFHKERKHIIDVDLYRIKGRDKDIEYSGEKKRRLRLSR